MRILVTGQCTLHWGRLEHGNIGNYYITETMFRELHRVFPDAEIYTTFQMTEDFCERENVNVLPMELYYNWDKNDLPNALKELGIAEVFSETQKVVDTTDYINEVRKCDIYIDFSGEMWGYHADLVGKDRFLVGLLKNRVAQLFGKPTVMLAGSQGRFPNPRIKKFAKKVFESFDLIANREAETGKLLVKDGFNLKNLKNYACPAFLFEPKSQDLMKAIFKKENLNNKKHKVGFSMCGFNMLLGPYDKWPRDDEEYTQFIELVEFLLDDLGVEVFFLSHSNGFQLNPDFKLIQGRDYPLIKQLYEILIKRNVVDIKKLHILEGPYNPWETKSIIGQFDMFITGRLHASVAATSQCVPTVVLMHGHKQKSHKTIGFFDILELPDCVVYPNNSLAMKTTAKFCWDNRAKIKLHLKNRVPYVQDLARKGFEEIKKFL